MATKERVGEIRLRSRVGRPFQARRNRLEVVRNDGEVEGMIIGVGNGQFMGCRSEFPESSGREGKIPGDGGILFAKYMVFHGRYTNPSKS